MWGRLNYATVSEYPVSKYVRGAYEQEMQTWITNGWLIPYPEKKLGIPKGIVPLMTVVQHNKGKVRPVIDYRELNKHVDAFIANADVCLAKLREWRQQGANMAILAKSVPYQTMRIKVKRFCLTRFGFSLNVAPPIYTVRLQEESIGRATSAYIDDVYVKAKLIQNGLMCKDPESLGLTCLDWKPKESVTICGGHQISLML